MLHDLGYRLHCWHGRAHQHISRSEAVACINAHQPGSKLARRDGCTCRIGHIYGGCPLHSQKAAAYRKEND
jgi:hypothetical protein